MRSHLFAAIVLIIAGLGWFLLSSFNKSWVQMYLSSDRLVIELHISSNDRVSYSHFINRLGAKEFNSVSLGLDEKSLSHLKNLLPTFAYLTFTPQGIKFSSPNNLDLNSSLPKESFNISSGSAEMSVEYKTDQDFSLKLKEPDVMLNYATSSARLYFSSKLYPLFPILGKIDTISLSVNGKSIAGAIDLR